MEIFAQVEASTETDATRLNPAQLAKLEIDITKLLAKLPEDMGIDSFSTVVGRIVQKEWGAHVTQRFTNNFINAVKESKEAEKAGE